MKLEINTKYDIGDIVNYYSYEKDSNQIVKILDIKLTEGTMLYPIKYLVEKPNKERLWVSEGSLVKRSNATLEERIKNGIMMYFGNRCY